MSFCSRGGGGLHPSMHLGRCVYPRMRLGRSVCPRMHLGRGVFLGVFAWGGCLPGGVHPFPTHELATDTVEGILLYCILVKIKITKNSHLQNPLLV